METKELEITKDDYHYLNLLQRVFDQAHGQVNFGHDAEELLRMIPALLEKHTETDKSGQEIIIDFYKRLAVRIHEGENWCDDPECEYDDWKDEI